MLTKNLAVLLAVSGAYASPISKRDECLDKCNASFDSCRTQPNANRAVCVAEYSDCVGYLPFNEEGTFVTPTACSSASTATTTAKSTADACLDKCNATYDSCRTQPNANRAVCVSEYSNCLGYAPFNDEGVFVTPTACAATATVTAAAAKPTADACLEQCNSTYDTCRTQPDANRAVCVAEYSSCLGYLPFNDEGVFVTPTACAPSAISVAAPASVQLKAAAAEEWTVKDLTRQCAEDRKACDYNFKVSTNDGQPDATCAIKRAGVANAPEESWYDQPCASGSPYKVSWGYSTQFETPFAVMTVVDTKKNAQAYFGVDNPTGQPVTPTSPYGSGNFGSIGPQPVTFN